MSKKIYFKTVDSKVVETINVILDVTFVNAYERKELSKMAKAIEKERDAFKAIPENAEASTVEFTNRLNIVKYKREALRKWTDTTLRTHKNSADQWEDGLFASIGITKDFCDAYLECRDEERWTKWHSIIRNMLVETYGMTLDDKLVTKFASYLEHQVGSSCAGINQVLKGQLLKPQTVRNFCEIMVRAIATYMAKTNDDIVIPTSELYTATVVYDKDYKNIEKYSVDVKTEDDK